MGILSILIIGDVTLLRVTTMAAGVQAVGSLPAPQSAEDHSG
jgi:hypothetical protein